MSYFFLILIFLLTFNLNTMQQAFRKPVGHINALSYSPEGAMLAQDAYTEVKIWDFNKQQYTHNLSVKDIISSLNFCTLDNKTKLISIPTIVSYDLTLWDLEDNKHSERFGNLFEESGLDTCSSDGAFCLHVDSQTQHPTMWEIKKKLFKQRFNNTKSDIIYSLAFSHDTQSCTFGTDSGINLFDVTTREMISTFKDGSTSHNGVAFSSGNGTLASASGRFIKLWDIKSGKNIHELPIQKLAVALACSPNDITIAYSTEDDQEVLLLDIRNGLIRFAK